MWNLENKTNSKAFQLTTSHGGRHMKERLATTHNETFNSRPHTEVDMERHEALMDDLKLSTHDLTRRSTREDSGRDRSRSLSTHDLTRRSTSKERLQKLKITSFNSRPHTEVDEIDLLSYPIRVLSTHDLTRRSTYWTDFDFMAENFQLTTSHGGRLGVGSMSRKSTN